MPDHDAGLPLVEIVPIEDDFCMGLGRIEDLGGEARFVLYTRQTCYEGGNATLYVVKRKIVLPLAAIRPGVEMTLGYLARKAARAAGDKLLRLVTTDDDSPPPPRTHHMAL